MQPDWDQIVADIGWELKYLEIPLNDGAVDLANVSDVLDSVGAEGWELMLIGHAPDDGTTQCCFRRAVPDRDRHVAQVQQLREHFEHRDN